MCGDLNSSYEYVFCISDEDECPVTNMELINSTSDVNTTTMLYEVVMSNSSQKHDPLISLHLSEGVPCLYDSEQNNEDDKAYSLLYNT
jgi:hypothetical protein